MKYFKYIMVGVFFIIFVLFTILMKPSADILNSSVYNIVDYEFLWTFDKYQTVMSTWSDVEISAAKMNTFLDFGWLIGYGGLIFSLNLLLSKKYGAIGKKVLISAAIAGVVAVSLDIIENILLLNMLYGTAITVFKGLPLIVSITALLKFIFVGYGIAVFVVMLIMRLIILSKRKANKE